MLSKHNPRHLPQNRRGRLNKVNAGAPERSCLPLLNEILRRKDEGREGSHGKMERGGKRPISMMYKGGDNYEVHHINYKPLAA